MPAAQAGPAGIPGFRGTGVPLPAAITEGKADEVRQRRVCELPSLGLRLDSLVRDNALVRLLYIAVAATYRLRRRRPMPPTYAQA